MRIQDRRLLEDFYPPYEGPIRIAGADATLWQGPEEQIALPFPGHRRMEASCPVTLDDVPAVKGRALARTTVGTGARQREEGPNCHVRLLWAAAGPAPKIPSPAGSLYSGL